MHIKSFNFKCSLNCKPRFAWAVCEWVKRKAESLAFLISKIMPGVLGTGKLITKYGATKAHYILNLNSLKWCIYIICFSSVGILKYGMKFQ
jgi:hypothetical protein